MHIITLTPPWGSLVAVAATRPDLGKSNETRSWPLPSAAVGEELAIHQAKGLPRDFTEADLAEICAEPPFREALAVLGITEAAQLPRGAIVAVVVPLQSHRIGALRMRFPRGVPDDHPLASYPIVLPPFADTPEYDFGDYRPGRYAWPLDQIRALRTPLKFQGAQGLRRLPDEVAAQVRAAL